MRLLMSFFPAMFEEMGRRRRRARGTFGDRGAAIVEFLVMSGLALGSLGLFLLPGMAAAAPWGFAMPVVFVLGFLWIERRRQRAFAGVQVDEADKDAAEERAEAVRTRTDWTVFLWSFGCALAGAAAFIVAWNARPIPPTPDWQPPRGTVDADIGPR